MPATPRLGALRRAADAGAGVLESRTTCWGCSSQAFRAMRVIVDIGLHLQLPIPVTEEYCPGRSGTGHGAAFVSRYCGFAGPGFARSDSIATAGCRPGDQLQGRRASLARHPRPAPSAAWIVIRPEAVPHGALNLGSLPLDLSSRSCWEATDPRPRSADQVMEVVRGAPAPVTSPRRQPRTPMRRGRADDSLGGFADLEDLGTADGQVRWSRFAVLHGDRLSALISRCSLHLRQ